MRLTIIPVDGYVSVDNSVKPYKLDLSDCSIPSDIHALQWYENRGWIEFSDNNDPFTPKAPNLEIYSLPEWAIAALTAYNNYVAPVAQPATTPTETN